MARPDICCTHCGAVIGRWHPDRLKISIPCRLVAAVIETGHVETRCGYCRATTILPLQFDAGLRARVVDSARC